MKIIESQAALRDTLTTARQAGKRIGLVPTMGNLHDGHLALVNSAKEHSDFIIVSIFINPLQFGPNEDYERYPRTYEQDLKKLTDAQCHAVFIPAISEMYPNGLNNQTRILVPEISNLYCGASRPGHFDGVCTIVNKLFNIVQPDIAFFGLKDYQQFFILKKMAEDLCMPVNLVGIPTIREKSGLALSSRNNFLADKQKHQASILYLTLKETKELILAGNRDYRALEQNAINKFQSLNLQLDYFSICNAKTLLQAETNDCSLVILSALYLGTTRLIDNIDVQADE